MVEWENLRNGCGVADLDVTTGESVEGERVTKVDFELSRRAARIVGGKPQSAWRKAWQALQMDSELENGLYIEGWAVTLDDLLIMEHGWLELQGRVVDPAGWERETAYFAGLRFDKAQMLAVLQNYPELPVTWHHGARLWDNPGYPRAWQKAMAFIQQEIARRSRAGRRDGLAPERGAPGEVSDRSERQQAWKDTLAFARSRIDQKSV